MFTLESEKRERNILTFYMEFWTLTFTQKLFDVLDIFRDEETSFLVLTKETLVEWEPGIPWWNGSEGYPGGLGARESVVEWEP